MPHTLSHATCSCHNLTLNMCSHRFSHTQYGSHAHVQCMLTQHASSRDRLPHMCSHVPMHIHSHVYILSHAHKSRCTDPQTHTHILRCLPKMRTHPGTDRKRHAGPLRNSQPHPWPPRDDTHGQTQKDTHNSRRHIYRKRPTPRLECGQFPKPRRTQRHTESPTHWAGRTHRQGDTRAHTVTARCSHAPRPPSGR